MLAIVHRVIAGWLAEQAGVARASARCGAVTLIQRFGSALNPKMVFHMLWFDGVCWDTTDQRQRKPRLHRRTTHVDGDAVNSIAKLAALAPPPRAHLTRFYSVFAPNAALRAQLTPMGRGKRPATDAALVEGSANDEPLSPEEKRRAMTRAQRLKRVFSIDVTTCIHCGGAVRIVARIEEAIRAIPVHFEQHGSREETHNKPAAHAPPEEAA